MAVTHTSLTSLFSDIADAIRGKTGGSASIMADDFPSAIAGIPSGGTVATATATGDGTGVISFSVSGNPIAFAILLTVQLNESEASSTTGTMVGLTWPINGSNYMRLNYMGITSGTPSNAFILSTTKNKSRITYSSGTLSIDFTNDTIRWANTREYQILYIY